MTTLFKGEKDKMIERNEMATHKSMFDEFANSRMFDFAKDSVECINVEKVIISDDHVYNVMSIIKSPMFFVSKDLKLETLCEIEKAKNSSSSSAKKVSFEGISKRSVAISERDGLCIWKFRKGKQGCNGVLTSTVAIDDVNTNSIYTTIQLFMEQDSSVIVSELLYNAAVNKIVKGANYVEMFVKAMLTLHQINCAYSLSTGLMIGNKKLKNVKIDKSDINNICANYDVIVNGDLFTSEELAVLNDMLQSYPSRSGKVKTVYDKIFIEETNGIVTFDSNRNSVVRSMKSNFNPEKYWKYLTSIATKLNAVDDLMTAIKFIRGKSYFSEQFSDVHSKVVLDISECKSYGVNTLFIGTPLYKMGVYPISNNLVPSSTYLILDYIFGLEYKMQLHYFSEDFGIGNRKIWNSNRLSSSFNGIMRDSLVDDNSYSNIFSKRLIERFGDNINYTFGKLYYNTLKRYGQDVNDKNCDYAMVMNNYGLDNIFSHIFGRTNRMDSTSFFGKAINIIGTFDGKRMNNVAKSNKSVLWIEAHGFNRNKSVAKSGILHYGTSGINEYDDDTMKKVSLCSGDYMLERFAIVIRGVKPRESYETATLDTGIWRTEYVGGNVARYQMADIAFNDILDDESLKSINVENTTFDKIYGINNDKSRSNSFIEAEIEFEKVRNDKGIDTGEKQGLYMNIKDKLKYMKNVEDVFDTAINNKIKDKIINSEEIKDEIEEFNDLDNDHREVVIAERFAVGVTSVEDADHLYKDAGRYVFDNNMDLRNNKFGNIVAFNFEGKFQIIDSKANKNNKTNACGMDTLMTLAKESDCDVGIVEDICRALRGNDNMNLTGDELRYVASKLDRDLITFEDVTINSDNKRIKCYRLQRSTAEKTKGYMMVYYKDGHYEPIISSRNADNYNNSNKRFLMNRILIDVKPVELYDDKLIYDDGHLDWLARDETIEPGMVYTSYNNKLKMNNIEYIKKRRLEIIGDENANNMKRFGKKVSSYDKVYKNMLENIRWKQSKKGQRNDKDELTGNDVII